MQLLLKPLAIAIHGTTPQCKENLLKESLEMEWLARHFNRRFPEDYRQARANINHS